MLTDHSRRLDREEWTCRRGRMFYSDTWSQCGHPTNGSSWSRHAFSSRGTQVRLSFGGRVRVEQSVQVCQRPVEGLLESSLLSAGLVDYAQLIEHDYHRVRLNDESGEKVLVGDHGYEAIYATEEQDDLIATRGRGRIELQRELNRAVRCCYVGTEYKRPLWVGFSVALGLFCAEVNACRWRPRRRCQRQTATGMQP